MLTELGAAVSGLSKNFFKSSTRNLRVSLFLLPTKASNWPRMFVLRPWKLWSKEDYEANQFIDPHILS